MNCQRCNGRGTISCPNYHDPLARLGYGKICQACKESREIQCPACLGKPIYAVEEKERKLSTLKDTGAARQNSEFTTARRVLAIHYLLDVFEVDLSNKSAETRFIKFLIDRDESDIKSKLTEIRERENPPDKRSKKTLPRSTRQRQEDLRFIRPFFVDLKLTRVTNAIDDEIKSTGEADSSEAS